MTRGVHIQKNLIALVIFLFFSAPAFSFAEQVKLKVIGDTWLSDANETERNQHRGKAIKFKLKSIQEMAILKFDPSPVSGRKITGARLFLHPVQPDNRLRYIRISTVNQDWKEGGFLGISGATYNKPGGTKHKAWAWPGSQFCDVSFSSGNSLTSWTEKQSEKDGWISIDVAPELIVAMIAGDTDGLAIMDGGTYNPFNNYIHSHESGGYAPYLMVEADSPSKIIPGIPKVVSTPDSEHSGMNSGAVRLKIQKDESVFCWKIKVNGRSIDRWQIPHPEDVPFTEFSISNLPPAQMIDISVTAVSATGHSSVPAEIRSRASSSLANELQFAEINPSESGNNIQLSGSHMKVWALPPLVKISPERPEPIYDDMAKGRANAVWDGKRIRLMGIKGEYVDFQLCIEALESGLKGVHIQPGPLMGPAGSLIRLSEIEIFRNWYSQTRNGQWQPAYQIPSGPFERFDIPDAGERIQGQTNQTLSIDVYIPKDIAAGIYKGNIKIYAHGISAVNIPVELEVHSPVMPDELAFWPEMNAYHIPENVHDYYRLAHQNRCVANFWAFRPKVHGKGKKIRLSWEAYDRLVGPLLSGTAFKHNRRKSHPIECLYLPYKDSWPTRLSKQTYNYKGYWPKKGDDISHLIDHYLTAPLMEEGLSQSYKDGFLSVQDQFIRHVKEKGWHRTEFQCFFGGKKKHRINYGSNMWWTTDEPYHWEDWLALRYLTGLWTTGREKLGASGSTWAARADISRPQWQGKVLDGSVDTVYFGGFNNAKVYKRCRLLKKNTGIRIRAYGPASDHERSNLEAVALVLNTWLNGADGYQVWWSTGRDQSLDVQEGTIGNAILISGRRFGISVLGDLRLKAFRKGEQLREYLVLLGKKHHLSRTQLKQMVVDALSVNRIQRKHISSKRTESDIPASIKAWQVTGLRREILKLL